MAERKKIIYEDYCYQTNKIYKNTTYYRCSEFTKGCHAKLTVKDGKYSICGLHICDQKLKMKTCELKSSKEFTKNFIDEMAQKLELFPYQIYQILLRKLGEEFSSAIYEIPSKNFVYSKIREIRGTFTMNSITTITSDPFKCLSNGKPFLRRYWLGDIRGESHKMLIYITDECLSLLRYNGHVFVDGTFRSCPAPFTQCVIISTFDRGTLKHIPCAYCLLTGKNEYLYCEMFHQLIVLLEYSWMPSFLTCDFEKALLASVKHQFPLTRNIGCYFHFKQSLLRKLKKITPNLQLIHSFLVEIELLTLVPINEIPLAIRHIKHIFQGYQILDPFWLYFENTWIKKFQPSLWNINNFQDNEIAGRTNNALERYNRRLNDFFINAHPNLVSFITIIRNKFIFFLTSVNKLEMIQHQFLTAKEIFSFHRSRNHI